jgi:DNA mismatch endonuclease (patch repair protein)
MADVFPARKRSEIMSKVKGRGNAATELRLIEVFRDSRIRGWRRHATIFGSPDFVFPVERLAVFVDGCFWHCCPVHCSIPKTNRSFWIGKLGRNQERDRLVRSTLEQTGWRVLRIWQHELRSSAKVARRVTRALAKPRRIPK